MKIFVASTTSDITAYRAEVIKQLSRIDNVTLSAMEYLGADPTPPKEVSLQEARTCDLFIGLLGHLYGSIPPGMLSRSPSRNTRRPPPQDGPR